MGSLIPEATFGDGEYLIDSIGIDEWNRMVDKITQSRPLQVSVVESDRFRHPWLTTLVWDAAAGRWGARLDTGYVNEAEVLVRVAVEDAPLRTFERLNVGDVSMVDAWLSEDPVLPVPNERWRAIGFGAPEIGGVEAVPTFFLAMGVESLRVETEVVGNSLVSSTAGTLSDGGGRRLLRAVDVVLVQPRPALTAGWGNEGGRAVFQLGVKMPHSESPFLRVVKKYLPAPEDDLGVLGGEDRGLDERWLATLYLVSPAGVSGGDVDGSWTPFVRHRVFWHLRYGVDQDLVAVQERAVSFNVPLAGGVGNLAVQGYLEANAGVEAQLEILLNRSRIRGQFWT